MSGRIEEIQPVILTGLGPIIHCHRMGFNCDSALAFQIHRIKKLILLVTLMDRTRGLEQSIGQSCFAVIDVRDDAEIARQFGSHESRTMRARGCPVNLGSTRASRAGDRAPRQLLDANRIGY